MRYHSLSSCLLLLLFVCLFALQPAITWSSPTTPEKKIEEQNREQPASQSSLGEKEDNQQGCCSYHQGVCGVTEENQILCCDGTTSPTCALPSAE